MFTIEQIESAHEKVKSGADFPKYIQEFKSLGVKSFETWVRDSHTVYFGDNGFSKTSDAQYEDLEIVDFVNQDRFISDLKIHQRGNTDYFTFCKDCAVSGIEKWVVDLDQMTCIYFDKLEKSILTEKIPS